jgi:cell division protein FtsB
MSRHVLSVILGLAILIVTASALFGEHGMAHLLRLRSERGELGTATFTLLEGNKRLRQEITQLKTDDLYVEGLARKQLGLVKPNEMVFRFPSARGDGR